MDEHLRLMREVYPGVAEQIELHKRLVEKLDKGQKE